MLPSVCPLCPMLPAALPCRLGQQGRLPDVPAMRQQASEYEALSAASLREAAEHQVEHSRQQEEAESLAEAVEALQQQMKMQQVPSNCMLDSL